ncbi:MAG: putative Ig domain-containing protein [Chthoniobacteraceae bacterium]
MDVLFPAKPPQVISSSPANGAGVSSQIRNISVTFDSTMLRAGLTDPRSVLNPANFTITDMATGLKIQVGAVTYDSAARRADLIFEPLAPSSYELRVLPTLQDDLGNSLASAYSATFGVVRDATAQLGGSVRFANTRLNRLAGTVSFDVSVTNTTTEAIAGPLRVSFPGITAQGLSFVSATGAMIPAVVDLLAGGSQLAVGASTAWVTVTVRNPNALALDFSGLTIQTGVPPSNQPKFLSTPTTAANAAATYRYAASAIDPRGTGVTYLLVSGPGGASINATTGALAWTPDAGSAAQSAFEIRAVNGTGAYARQTWSVIVSGTNAAPVLAAVADQRVAEGQLLMVRFAAVDPEGLPVTFFVDHLPAGATFDAATATLRWRPGALQAGTYPGVRVTASDGVSETTRTFQIIVTPTNLAPEFTQPVDRTVSEGSAVSFVLRATDPEGKALTFSSSTLPTGAVLVPATGRFLWTPGYYQHGTYDVPVTVSDGEQSVTRTFRITVLNVNGAVRFVPLESLQVLAGQSLTVRVVAIDSNVAPATEQTSLLSAPTSSSAQSTLTYAFTTLPNGATYDTATQLLTWTPRYNQAGSYSITFTATNDGDGTGTPNSDTQTVHIAVLPQNGAPVVTAITNQTLAVNSTLTVPLSATDPNGDPLTLSISGLPSFATLTANGNGTGSIAFSPVPGHRGNYVLTFRATDNGGGIAANVLFAETQFVLNVTSVNEPPKMGFVGPAVAVVGQEVRFSVRVDDAEQNPLTYSADNLPTGATFIGTSVYGVAEFRWTPQAGDAGSRDITLRAADDGNGGLGAVASDTRTFRITVRSANASPVLVPVPSQNAAQNQPLTFTLSATDPDGDTITYLGSGLPRGAVLDPQTGVFRWTPDFAQSGNFTFSLSATDGNRTSSATVSIGVTRTTRAPVWTTAPSVLGQEGLQLSFIVSAASLDGDALTFYVKNLPKGASFNSDTRIFAWTPGYGQGGVYNIVFAARNPAGQESTSTALVQILKVNRPPVFDVPPARQVVAGNELRFTLVASDSDAGDVLTFSASDLPAGATLNAGTGEFVWRPAGVQAGRVDIPITVSDGRTSITQILPIVVSLAPQLPSVRLDLTPSFAVTPGGTVVIQATASSVSPIQSISISIDGVVQTPDRFGRVTYRPTAPGQIRIQASATDLDGFTGTAETFLKVRDPADRTAPAIAVDVPPALAVLTTPTVVRGSVSDVNLDFWRLELAPLGSASVRVLASGTASVSGVLGTIDTRNLENGPYTLRLVARDISGRETVGERIIEVGGTDKSAAYVRVETDVTATLGGLSVAISRRYSSLAVNENGLFGIGWQFVLAEPRFAANVAPTGSESDGFFAAFSRDTRVTVTLPTGNRVAFVFTPTAVSVGGLTYYRPSWTAADATTTYTLSSAGALIEERGGAFYQIGTGLPYNPASARFGSEDYALTAPDGTRYGYTVAEGLRTVTGSNGTRLVWTDAGFVASNGDRLLVERGTGGRIIRVATPAGDSAVYSYAANGTLLQVVRLESGRRTWLGYRADGGRLLTEVAGDNAVAVRYDSQNAVLGVDPVRVVLGTSRQFLSGTQSGSVVAGGADRLAIVIGASELATAQNGLLTLGFDVTGLAGFQPGAITLSGQTPVFVSMPSGRSLALFTIRTPGPLVLEITGRTATDAGSYNLAIYLAGDVNGDGAVDGTDETAFNTADGSASGNARYNIAADINRDGVIDAQDRAYLTAGFGFIAASSPVAQGAAFNTAGGVPVAVDLTRLASDPNGIRLNFVITGTTNGTVRLIDGGRTAVFTPTAGFVGAGGFTYAADNGDLRSAPATVTVNSLSTTLANLRLTSTGPNIQAGSLITIGVLGDLPDGTTLTLDPSQYTVTTSNAAVANVSRDGAVLGVSSGTAVLRFQLSTGGVLATPVTVGVADTRLIEFFPESYVLTTGGTRQFVVRERLTASIVDHTAATAGTSYFTSDASVASITADGLLTALRIGEVTISVMNGGVAKFIRIRIVTPLNSGAVVGSGGGIVTNGSVTVGIPSGSLRSDSTVTVSTLDASAMPQSLPDGFVFGGGFNVDWGGGETDQPFSISLPAPAGWAVGREAWIFQPVTVVRGNGLPDELSWLVLDKMAVTADGRLVTTSPPNIALASRLNQFTTGLLFVPNLAGKAFIGGTEGVAGAVNAIADLALRDRTFSGVVSLQTVRGTGPHGPSYYSVSSVLGDLLIPAVSGLSYHLNLWAASESGLQPVADSDIQVAPGEIKAIGIPMPPRFVTSGVQPPRITDVSFRYSQVGSTLIPQLVITGQDFTLDNPFGVSRAGLLGSRARDLIVTIEVGGRDSTNPDGTPNPVGGTDITITGTAITSEASGTRLVITLPLGSQLGGTNITVTRPMKLPLDGSFRTQLLVSNPGQIFVQSRYVFSANAGDDTISFIDSAATTTVTAPSGSVTKFDPKEIARSGIAGGSGGPLSPRTVTSSVDGTRAYVTLELGAGVAVFDFVTGQQIDVDPETPGVQFIRLTPGTRAWAATAEKSGRFLYVSDSISGTVCVIDIDPFSNKYNKVVQYITLPGVGLGLRGLALSSDDARLYVTAPGRTSTGQYSSTNGSIYVIKTNAAKREKPAYAESATTKISVGPEPYSITGTDDPNVMLWVDRLDDSQGVGVLRRSLVGDVEVYQKNTINLTPFGQILRIIEGRNTQVFGVSNAADIVYLPANALKAQLADPAHGITGEHPAFAFIVGQTRYKADDPKKDPNLGPIFAYNYLLTDGAGHTASVPLSAGGNIGIIRNPLGDFSSAITQPRLVAATSTIANGFPESLTLAANNLQVVAAMQGVHSLFVYDTVQMIRTIEREARAGPNAVPDYSQLKSENIPLSLMRLLRGPLSTVPIDAYAPQVKISADYGWYSDGAGGAGYGVPNVGPAGESPNAYAPLALPAQRPRGVGSVSPNTGTLLSLTFTPYNQTSSLNAFPNDSLEVEAGRHSVVEVHTGAFREEHSLVTFQSAGKQAGLALDYDSTRAEARPIVYVSFAGLKTPIDDSRIVLRMTLRYGDKIYRPAGLDAEQAETLGLSVGDIIVKLPASAEPDAIYGIGIPFDLSDAETGLYTLSVEYGVARVQESRLIMGRTLTYTQPWAVVNSKDSVFGAGWGLANYYEIYSGNGGILLVDGNGNEQIYLAPRNRGDPFTSLAAADYSSITQEADGKFKRRMLDGTTYRFDTRGKLSTVTDRNGNVIRYITETVGVGDDEVTRIKQIRYEPNGFQSLSNEFTYSGSLLSKVTDPAGRVTKFAYDAKGNLTGITDPDTSLRNFEYKNADFTHLITGQYSKRANPVAFATETLTREDFHETISYDIFGRVNGGKRADGKQFTLKPAQVFAAVELKNAVSLEGKAKLIQLAITNDATKINAAASYVDFRDQRTDFGLSTFGSYVSTRDDQGVERNAERGPNGLIVTETDASKNKRVYGYDAFNNLTSIMDYPDGPGTTRAVTVTMEYDTEHFNRMVRQVDGVGRVTTWDVNPTNGDIRSSTILDPHAPAGSPGTTSTSFTYYPSGQVNVQTDALSHAAIYSYDGYGRLRQVALENGDLRITEYKDLTGNVSATVDERSRRTEFRYDAMNRLKERKVFGAPDGGSFIWQLGYDAEGNNIRQTDSRDVVSSITYDAIDRIIQRTDALNTPDTRTIYLGYGLNAFATTYSVPTGEGYTYNYVRDAMDGVSVTVFNRDNQIVAQIDQLGRKTVNGYDTGKRLYTTTLPNEGVITYYYDGRNRVVRQTGPTREDVVTVYDDANRIKERTITNDRNGGNQDTFFEYNLFNQVAKLTDAEENVTVNEYDLVGNLKKSTEGKDSNSEFVTKFTYDDLNRVSTRTEQDIATHTYTYWEGGKLKTVQDPRGAGYVTSYDYDVLDRVISIKNAENEITIRRFDGEGNLLFEIDPRGGGDDGNTQFRTSYEYDKLNRLSKTTDPVGAVILRTYDKSGNLKTVSDPRNQQWLTKFEYDAANQLTKITDALNFVAIYEYDKMGNRASVTDPRAHGAVDAGFTKRFTYDKSSRLITMEDALHQGTTYDRDQAGHVWRVNPPQGQSYRYEVILDRLNREVSRTQAPGTRDAITTTTQYNALGLVIETKDARGIETIYAYTALRFLETLTEAVGTVVERKTDYDTDLVGNIKVIKDPRGTYYNTTQTFDKVSRLLSVSRNTGLPNDPGPVSKVNYTYDDAGNPATVSDPRNGNWLTTYSYDARNKLVLMTDAEGLKTAFKYDLAGNLTAKVDPRGLGSPDNTTYGVVMTYDQLNRLKTVADPEGVSVKSVTTFFYDEAGNKIRSERGPRGGVTTWEYDALNRLRAMTDAEKDRTEYDYNPANKVIEIRDPRDFGPTGAVFKRTMTYDYLNRMITRTASIGFAGGSNMDATEVFTYDGNGNIRTKQDPRGAYYTSLLDYDELDRLITLTEPGGNTALPGQSLVTHFGYDAADNVTSITDARGDYYKIVRAFDPFNRLIESRQPTGTQGAPGPVAITRYVYDAAGHLTREIDPRGAYYTTVRAYDKNGRLTSVTRPTGSADSPRPDSVVTYDYDLAGNVKLETRVRTGGLDGSVDLVTQYDYDARNRVTKVTDPLLQITRNQYDADGNLERITSVGGSDGDRVIEMTYDLVGRLKTRKDAGGFVLTNFYDEVGNLVRTTGPFYTASGGLTQTRRVYDGGNRLRRFTNEENYVTTYEYDAAGNRTSVTDGRGFYYRIEAEYDFRGNVVAREYPTGSVDQPGPRLRETMKYDGANNLISKVDPRGQAFESKMTYDARNLLTELRRPDGPSGALVTAIALYSYDLASNLVSETDARGFTTTFDYDAMNYRNKVTMPAGTLDAPRTLSESFTYDTEGNLVRHVGRGGSDYVTTYIYDRLNRASTRTDPIGEVESWTYDRFGNIATHTTPDGTTTFKYDKIDRVTSIKDALMHTSSFSYPGGGNIVRSSDPLGNPTESAYDGLGRLVRRTDALGKSDTMEYDAVGNLTAQIDRRGTRTERTYDARNLLLREMIAVGTADSVARTLSYDNMGWLATEIGFKGADQLTTYVRDNMGRITKRTRETGGGQAAIVELFTYDLAGNLRTQTTGRGAYFTSTYVYDRLNQVVSITRPVGDGASDLRYATETYGYNDAGQQTDIFNALGFHVQRTYDLVGRIRKETIFTDSAPYGKVEATWTYEAATLGLKVTYVDGLGTTASATQYDKLGRVLSVVSREAGTTVNTYDDAGNLAVMTQGTVRRTYGYDALNRRTSTTDEDGNSVTLDYTRYYTSGIMVSTDGRGKKTTYTYDRLYRQRSVKDPTGATTLMDFDGAGNLMHVLDAAGNPTDYIYDFVNRRITETTQSGVRTYTYDADGNLVSYKDRNNRITNYTLDAMGRAVKETWVGGGSAGSDYLITSSYDLAGRLMSTTDGEWTNDYGYTGDVRGLLNSNTTRGPPSYGTTVITYTLNAIGAVTKTTLSRDGGPALVVNDYTYDSSTNRLSSISQQGTFAAQKRVQYGYATGNLRIERIERYDAASGGQMIVSTEIGYNSRNLTLSIWHRTAAGVTLNNYTYGYDGNGFVESRQDADGGVSYTYDDSGQTAVVSYDDPAMATESYSYDGAGNRINSSRRSGGSFGPDNRLMADSEYTYSYDGEGNLKRATRLSDRTVFEYDWDYRNRLVEVRIKSSTGVLLSQVNYAYDAANHRTASAQTNGLGVGPVTYFVMDRDDVLLELRDADGSAGPSRAAPQRAYLHGLRTDELVAQDDGTAASVRWLLGDNEGTIRDIADSHGVKVDHLKIDSFGNVAARQSTGPDLISRYIFHGREYEAAIGLYYFRARFYDPGSGRFLGVDPTGLSSGDTNFYRFANNSPANLHDPSGLSWLGDKTYSVVDTFAHGLDTAATFWHDFENAPTTDGEILKPLAQIGVGFADRVWSGAAALVGGYVADVFGTYGGMIQGKDYTAKSPFGQFVAQAGYQSGMSGSSGLGAFAMIAPSFLGHAAVGVPMSLVEVVKSTYHAATTGSGYGEVGGALADFAGSVDGFEAAWSITKAVGRRFTGLRQGLAGVASDALKHREWNVRFLEPETVAALEKGIASDFAAIGGEISSFAKRASGGLRLAGQMVTSLASSAFMGLSDFLIGNVSKGVQGLIPEATRAVLARFDLEIASLEQRAFRTSMADEIAASNARAMEFKIYKRQQAIRQIVEEAAATNAWVDAQYAAGMRRQMGEGYRPGSTTTVTGGEVASSGASASVSGGINLADIKVRSRDMYSKMFATKEAFAQGLLDHIALEIGDTSSYNKQYLADLLPPEAVLGAGDMNIQAVLHLDKLPGYAAGNIYENYFLSNYTFFTEEGLAALKQRLGDGVVKTVGEPLADLKKQGISGQFEVETHQGKLRYKDSTQTVIATAGEWKLVMDEFGRKYVIEADHPGIGAVKHSSPLGWDGEVAFAGRLFTDDSGLITLLTDQSGHYGAKLLAREAGRGGALDILASRLVEEGIDASQLKVGFAGDAQQYAPMSHIHTPSVATPLPKVISGGPPSVAEMGGWGRWSAAEAVTSRSSGIRSSALSGAAEQTLSRATAASSPLGMGVRIPPTAVNNAVGFLVDHALGGFWSEMYGGLSNRSISIPMGGVTSTLQAGASVFLGGVNSVRGVVQNAVTTFMGRATAFQGAVASGTLRLAAGVNLFLETRTGLFTPPKLTADAARITAVNEYFSPFESRLARAQGEAAFLRPGQSALVGMEGILARMGSNLTQSAEDLAVPLAGRDGTTTQTVASATAPDAARLSVIVDAAKLYWSRVLGSSISLQLNVSLADLPAGQLGFATITAVGGNGLPTAGRLLVDRSGGGRGWFADLSPLLSEDFGSQSSAGAKALSGAAADGRYDLLTLVTHEMGHLLGFTQNFSGFAANIQVGLGGAAFYVSDGISELLSTDRDHLSSTTRPGALMTSTLSAGVRRLPSELEGRMLRAAWDSAAGDMSLGRQPSFQLAGGVFGFVMLSDAAVAGLASPNSTLVNGTFAGGSGWSLIDNASITGGRGVLRAGTGMLSQMVQTFVIPERALTLQFTVTGYQLSAGGALPPDAFEAGLFDTRTGISLLPSVALTEADALVNLQGGSVLNLATAVRILRGSLGGAGDIVFSIDLSGIEAGTVVTLTFDLATFGTRGSTVSIDDVAIFTSPNPSLPTAKNDTYAASHNNTLDVPAATGVLVNDSAPGGGPLTAVLVQGPANGTLTFNSDGSFRYVPNTGFIGQDTFFYRANSLDVLSDLASVIITVADGQRAPSFNVGPDVTVQGNGVARTITGWATGIIAGLPLPAGTAVLVFHVTTDHPELFSVQPAVSADGTLTFTPAANAHGIATMTVRLQDNGGTDSGRQDTSAPQQFTIAVQAINQPPTFNVGSDVVVNQNSGSVVIVGWIVRIAAGPAGSPATVVFFILTTDKPFLFTAQPQVSGAGTLSFTPASGAYGTAAVSLVAQNDGGTADGGSDTSAPQTFTILIAALPVITPATPGTVGGGGISQNGVRTGLPGLGGFIWIQINAPFAAAPFGRAADGSPFGVRILSGPAWLGVDASGRLVGTPRPGDFGFSYLVVEAFTPTGGSVMQSYIISLYRDTETPGEWIPWRKIRRYSSLLDGTASRSSAARLLDVTLGAKPKHLPASQAHLDGRRITCRLPLRITQFAVRVFTPGADGLFGTADDIEIPVRRAALSSNGDIILDLAEAPPAGSRIRIQVDAAGEVFIVTLVVPGN